MLECSCGNFCFTLSWNSYVCAQSTQRAELYSDLVAPASVLCSSVPSSSIWEQVANEDPRILWLGNSVTCIRSGRITGLSFWSKWAEERCFFPLAKQDLGWIQNLLLNKDLQIPSLYRLRCKKLSLKQGRASEHSAAEQNFSILWNNLWTVGWPIARPSVKKGLQVSKFSLFNLLASPLWGRQPHSKEQELTLLT